MRILLILLDPVKIIDMIGACDQTSCFLGKIIRVISCSIIIGVIRGKKKSDQIFGVV